MTKIDETRMTVRLTEDERRVLAEAAYREKRSVARFLIYHGLAAAKRCAIGAVLGPK